MQIYIPSLCQIGILKGLFIPWCIDCSSDAWLQAVAAVGAIIMPHNLYLHSALVKTRSVDINDKRAVRVANKYFFIEGSIAIFISFLISLTVIAVFGQSYYGLTYADANELCNGTKFDEVFADPDK